MLLWGSERVWGLRSWEYHVLETYSVRVKSWDSLFTSKKKRVRYLTWSQDQLIEVKEEGEAVLSCARKARSLVYRKELTCLTCLAIPWAPEWPG